MTFLEEGIRLKSVLDEKTCFFFAKAWKKYADERKLAQYRASMLLLCSESGISFLRPVQTPADIHEIVSGMLVEKMAVE